MLTIQWNEGVVEAGSPSARCLEEEGSIPRQEGRVWMEVVEDCRCALHCPSMEAAEKESWEHQRLKWEGEVEVRSDQRPRRVALGEGRKGHWNFGLG